MQIAELSDQIQELHNNMSLSHQEKYSTDGKKKIQLEFFLTLSAAKQQTEKELEEVRQLYQQLDQERKTFREQKRKQTSEFHQIKMTLTAKLHRLEQENHLLRESGATLEENKQFQEEREREVRERLEQEESIRNKMEFLESNKEELEKNVQELASVLKVTQGKNIYW
jgi:chromosome segregation ATPase